MESRTYFRKMRKSKEISLKELAQVLHCTVPLISMHERNKASMCYEKEMQYKKYIKEHKQ
jgi:transcriptional regulator with XRE-family HTH domain